jgi:hypothetical protein
VKPIDSLLGCNWLHSVWTKLFVCKDAFTGIPLFRVPSEDYFQFLLSCPDYVSSRSDTHLSTVSSVRTTYPTFRMPDRLSIILPDNVHFRPDLHCFEKLLFQLASVRTSQQPIRTPLIDRSALDSFQVQFKGRLLQPSERAHT